MRISRVYVDLPLQSDREQLLPDAPSRHLLQVLRLRAGAELTVFNGRGGEFGATLLGTTKSAARVRIGAHRAIERESPLALTLLQGVARGERMDLVIQKAVELGVAQIVPVLADFSTVRLDGAQTVKRLAHWQGVVIAACEQCGRNHLPEVATPIRLVEALSKLATDTRRLLLEPGAAVNLTAAAAGARDISLLIGPEGGLSPAELQLAARAGFIASSLGPRVLRTETAPLAALAILQSTAGDLG
jgi:16S rRNA (uracil1498-N3)-methyltransferase